jgi:hypothetical protein
MVFNYYHHDVSHIHTQTTSSLSIPTPGAWLSEEAMFLGVGIYLLVDNCIVPFRTNRY